MPTDPVKRAEAYGRFKARFKPGNNIRVFHDGDMMQVVDISDDGCRLANAGRFTPDQTYVLDLVFQEKTEIAGWRVKAECRWTTQTEAGFQFDVERLGSAISNRIARQHLRGGLRILNGLHV